MLKANSVSQHVSMEIKPIEDSSNFKLVATLHAPGTGTTIRVNITIYINGNDEPALEIPLYARVVESP